MTDSTVWQRLDAVVDAFCRRVRYFREPMTPGRARSFVRQHRLNTRQRNSVLKLRVATNCTHWEILEELGTHIGLSLEEIRAAEPLPSTQIAWAAWEGLMSNRHWIEGIVANTCAERINIPGYGTGALREHGWFGLERQRWGRLFGLSNEQLDFFELHEQADIEHSDMGWQAVARFSAQYGMEDAAVKACEINLRVWELYLTGIAEAGDRD